MKLLPALAAASALAFTGAAQAQFPSPSSAQAPAQAQFSFDRAALAEPAEARRAYSALSLQARQLCADTHRHGVMPERRIRSCTGATMDDAIDRIDDPSLNALHTGAPERAIQTAMIEDDQG